MTEAKIPQKTTIDIKRDKHEVTSQFAFDGEAKRLAKLTDKTARLRALREAEELRGK